MGLCWSKQKFMNLYVDTHSGLSMEVEVFGQEFQTSDSLRTLVLSVPCKSFSHAHSILRGILVDDLGIIDLALTTYSQGNVPCYLRTYIPRSTRGINLIDRPRLYFEKDSNVKGDFYYVEFGRTYEDARAKLKNRILRDLKI